MPPREAMLAFVALVSTAVIISVRAVLHHTNTGSAHAVH
jgi:hypothetical protein